MLELASEIKQKRALLIYKISFVLPAIWVAIFLIGYKVNGYSIENRFSFIIAILMYYIATSFMFLGAAKTYAARYSTANMLWSLAELMLCFCFITLPFKFRVKELPLHESIMWDGITVSYFFILSSVLLWMAIDKFRYIISGTHSLISTICSCIMILMTPLVLITYGSRHTVPALLIVLIAAKSILLLAVSLYSFTRKKAEYIKGIDIIASLVPFIIDIAICAVTYSQGGGFWKDYYVFGSLSLFAYIPMLVSFISLGSIKRLSEDELQDSYYAIEDASINS